jgi:hypothetical protein
LLAPLAGRIYDHAPRHAVPVDAKRSGSRRNHLMMENGSRLHGGRVPTILRAQGYRFFFFSNEGDEPPHIHVERAECAAKFLALSTVSG